jgi:hypothetical protein
MTLIESRREQGARSRRRPIPPIPREQELDLISEAIEAGRITRLPPVYTGELRPHDPRCIVRQTIDLVAQQFGLKNGTITGKYTGNPKARLARYAVYWLLRERHGMNEYEIANALTCSRGSVAAGLARVERERRSGGELAERLMGLLG